jgi:uncharacterized protein (TIGR03435 family)
MLKARLLAAVGIMAVVASSLAGVLTAQTPAKPLAFEVASIKPNKSGGRGAAGGMHPGGRFVVTNATVFRMIANAYRVRDSQVLAGPNWINSDHFDIVAKTNGSPTADQRALMFQSLLADRFGLALHHETRELTEFTLVMARNDKKLGPRLHPASAVDTDCTGAAAAGLIIDPVSGLPLVRPCGLQFTPGRFTARGMTMDELASTLAGRGGLSFFVENKTGLSGKFNVDLEWAENPTPSSSSADGPSAPADRPSIFTAVQEQLGLKLQSTKGPVDVLVIDHVEHPTED